MLYNYFTINFLRIYTGVACVLSEELENIHTVEHLLNTTLPDEGRSLNINDKEGESQQLPTTGTNLDLSECDEDDDNLSLNDYSHNTSSDFREAPESEVL